MRFGAPMATSSLTRLILLLLTSVNQRLPSGPAVIPPGQALAVGAVKSVAVPAAVMRPMLPLTLLPSVNQRLPSAPAVIRLGPLFAVGTGNSVTVPAVVMRPILLLLPSVNQRLPSGPAVIPP